MRTSLTIVVGSTNPVKIAAAKTALAAFFPDSSITCQGIDAPSGVPDQPMSDADTRQGALNRLHYCQQHKAADFYVAIEGGVDKLADGPATFAYVAIADAKQRSVGRSASLPLPESVYQALAAGEELGDVMDRLFGTSNIKQQCGAIGLLTGHQATRESTYILALTLAFAPFLHPDRY
ncbi:inosine/xanthosine triphosphatase [Gallaecimonas sp. GXIMD1310]|uniref:inosine/xanthosine triphosphatase n=1 Tax=Gallaecimonas sp. GXIMD1310 TaxID=3131926 RepID=UPI0032440116